jgi:hypothetical protein
MTTFDDREKAFEARFAHDAALRFRVLARRGRLAGLWAAGRLGMTGEAADAYAGEVLLSDFEVPGDEDIIARLLADLAPLGVTRAEVEHVLADTLVEAEAQVKDAD